VGTLFPEALVVPFRQWRASHLFRSWAVYWVALLAVAGWRPVVEYWRISHSATKHGTVNFTYSGGMLPLALWIAGPPLALFVVWLVTRSRTPETVERERA
jgi:hypothetical protein